MVEKEWNIAHHAICIVSETNLADYEEIQEHIKDLNKTIGTGYYDDSDGDELLKQIVAYLTKKLEEDDRRSAQDRT